MRTNARSGTLVAEVTAIIRSRILTGALVSGKPIREAALATELGVSRAPVREAMRMLEQSGMVIKSLNRSYSVMSMTERDILELVTLRMALEPLAARLAFGRNQLIVAMESAMEEMERALEGNDYEAAVAANRTFHEGIISAADHKRLASAYQGLFDQMELAYLSYAQRRPAVSSIVAHHKILVDIAKTGTVEEFVAELSSHIQDGLSVFSNSLQMTINPLTARAVDTGESSVSVAPRGRRGRASHKDVPTLHNA